MANQLTQHSFTADWDDRPLPIPAGKVDYAHRALGIWPGLEPGLLRHAHDDPLRIGRLVASRTGLRIETILALLGYDP
jgi:hypothetical protein